MPEFPCHRERKRGDPLEKVRGIYSDPYSNGLPWSLCSLAMTKCLCERSEANSREGGFPQGIYYFTLVVGYFAYAQYDELFLHVILSMSSEQTCLQGFASDDIHKALAFL